MTQPGPPSEITPDPSRQERAKEYARLRRRLGFLDLALSAVLLGLLAFAGLSQRLTGLLSLPVVPGAAVYLVCLLAAYSIITAPLDYYTGFVLPHRYGLSVQSLRGWLADQARAGALGLLLGAGAVAAVYWFIVTFPDLWWLLAWALLFVAGVLAAHLAPVLIVPLFLKMKPLEEPELKARLERLARKAGIRVRGVYLLELSRKSTAANAALMGTGRTRRIVLTDTLLKSYSPAEIEVILAHEIGHHVHADIPRGMAIQALALLAGLYITSLIFGAAAPALGYSGIADVAALPLLVFIAAGLNFIVSPLSNARSRRREAAADEYALTLSGDPYSFISMMTKLTDQNLGEANPPGWVERFTYSHPSYAHRVEHARRHLAAKGSDAA